MRASTLFGIAIALFLGAGAIVAIRYFGLLETHVVASPKVEPVMVLAAKNNIFELTTATMQDVVIREATEAEKRDVLEHGERYMPARVEAAQLRMAKRHISVGEILRKDDFLDQVIPDPVSMRLEPGMRAVNIVLPRDRAAGGLIRVGEFVDVYLTATICADAKCSNPRTATAPLAKNLKVVIKRNSLWTMMVADPEDKPVSFILQANAYRAALIELAKSKGSISLMPSFPDPNVRVSPANAKLEETRAAAFLSGEAVVSDTDLEKIFNLQPGATTEPPLAIEHYSGIKFVGTTVHDRNLGYTMGNASRGYNFYPPGQLGTAAMQQATFNPSIQNFNPSIQSNLGDCPTCGKGGTR